MVRTTEFAPGLPITANVSPRPNGAPGTDAISKMTALAQHIDLADENKHQKGESFALVREATVYSVRFHLLQRDDDAPILSLVFQDGFSVGITVGH